MNVSYKKKSVLWWMLQIIPPLCILPLSALPMDMHTSIFWGAGIIVFLISIFSICRIFFRQLRAKEKNSTIAGVLRPGLVIIFMIVAISSVKYSLSKAENFAFETAKSIQKECTSNNNCPDFIPAWNKRDDSFAYDYLAGGLVKYRVLYDVNDDKKEFRIMLRINIDKNLYFSGGVGKRVQRSFHRS